MNNPCLILDLDGVIMSKTDYLSRNSLDFVESIRLLEAWGKKGRVFVATNRTPAEMQSIAYFLGISTGSWITENGGSIYTVENEMVEYPNEMKLYIELHIPALRQHLSTNPRIVLHHTTGLIRSIISLPQEISRELFIESILKPHFENFPYKDRFVLSTTKVISIEPKGLSKKIGLPLLFQKNTISPQLDTLFFVGDNDRDIEIAKELSTLNATIGCVGNSTSQYKMYVEHLKNGICAPSTSSYHSSLNILLRSFDSSLK